MKTLNPTLINTKSGICLICLFFLLQSCCSVAPVTTSVESARLVEKGKVEGAVMYSSYSAKQEHYRYEYSASNGFYSEKTYSSMETLNNNYGFRIVAGGEKTNIGFHYERLNCHECGLVVNYFAIETKFKMHESKNSSSAFSIPLGIYIPEKDEGGEVYQLMPSFHFTYGGSKYFEFSFSPKALFILNHPSLPLLNMTAGFGLSSDISQWAIRPEIGYTISPYGGNGILQTAIGVSFSFGK